MSHQTWIVSGWRTGPENGWLIMIFLVNKNPQLTIEIINKTRGGTGENCSQKLVTKGCNICKNWGAN